jgi:hypothetical protein
MLCRRCFGHLLLLLPLLNPIEPQVLLTVASDARELLEVRRSEAALMVQLADALAKLKVCRQ